MTTLTFLMTGLSVFFLVMSFQEPFTYFAFLGTAAAVCLLAEEL